MEDIYVQPQQRRKGVGLSLLRSVSQVCLPQQSLILWPIVVFTLLVCALSERIESNVIANKPPAAENILKLGYRS